MPVLGQVIELPPPPVLEPRPLAWSESFAPLTTEERVRYHYVNRLVGPWSLMTAGYASAMDASQDDPLEWDGRGDAYARRFSARIATRFVRNSIRLGIESFTHEDPRFFRSGETGFRQRTKIVLLQSVRARKEGGGTTFAYGRVIGAFAAAQISQLWYPGSRDGFRENLQRGGMVLVADLGTRMLREFWPEVRRALRIKKKSNPRYPL